MADNVIFIVTERELILAGGMAKRENVEVIKEMETQFIYSNDISKNEHVKSWARDNNVKIYPGAQSARRIDEIHHNDWTDERKQYFVKEIEVTKKEIRGYFRGRTA